MNDVQIQVGDYGAILFFVEENGEQIALLDTRVNGNVLKAIHTEVTEAGKGKGLAAKLVAAMVDYARSHSLKVVPLCPYVKTTFERHPERYADIWER